MKQILLRLFTLCMTLTACIDESQVAYFENVVISGNECLEDDSSTRSIPILLPEGSRIKLNATGFWQCHDAIFTYTNGRWFSNDKVIQAENADETTIVALHPTLPSYDASYIYEDNNLADLLFVNAVYSAKSKIHLQFSHLFSRITFIINDAFINQMEWISIVSPYSVTEVNPMTTACTYQKVPIQSTISCHGNSEYSFIIPPMEQNLTLILSINGKEYIQALSSFNFQSNHHYTCEIKSATENKGIRTADDFITFCRLINGDITYTGEKTLEDFSSIEGERTIYSLLNDISLEGEETISFTLNPKAFNDIFEGNGHCITYPFYIQTPSYASIFPLLGEYGIIRNLQIENASWSITKKCNAIGILCAENKGLITGCAIKNASITLQKDEADLGILTGTSYGKLVNCAVTASLLNISNSTFTNITAGMATGYLYGDILNCYFVGNQINTADNYSGGIFGMDYGKGIRVANCYTSCNISYKKKTKTGAIAGLNGYAAMDNCYIDAQKIAKATGNKVTNPSGTHLYTADFMESVSHYAILDSLNNWIKRNQENYPDTRFRLWQKDEVLPAIFVRL